MSACRALAEAFGASFQAVQWVVIAYLLAITDAGRQRRAARRHGRPPTLAAWRHRRSSPRPRCCAVWRRRSRLLVAARAVQGVGRGGHDGADHGAGERNGAEAKTGSAMGLLGTMSAIGTALGPSLGGVLIAGCGWPAIFWSTCRSAGGLPSWSHRAPSGRSARLPPRSAPASTSPARGCSR